MEGSGGTTAAAPACEHDGDHVVIESSLGLNYWCMDCGALKMPGEPSWTLPRPAGRPPDDPSVGRGREEVS